MQELGQKSQKEKRPYLMRVLFFSIISAIIITGGAVWFLSAEGIISSLWALIITIVLTAGGIIATVYFGIFPLSPTSALSSKAKSISLTSVNKTYSQNANLAASIPDPTIVTNLEQIAHDSGRKTFDEAQHFNYEEQQTRPNRAKYNTAVIRKLLTEAFTDQDLEDLCMDYFPPVQDRFTLGMNKQQKIQQLIEYCSRHDKFPYLLNLVKQNNSSKYKQYENTLIDTSR